MQCKFCKRTELMEYYGVDFYLCDKCESIMCIMCMETSIATGRDFCLYCWRNMKWEGKKV